MEKVVSLKIETSDEVLEIPFLDLKCLDLFTVRYENRNELINALSDMLDLSINCNNVVNIYVYCEYLSRNNLHKYKNDYVMYKKDNFNINYLGDSFKEYLKQDHNRIKKCGVKDIRTKAMAEFMLNDRDLSDFDIDYAVDKYLENAPYRTYRKIYFMIKDSVRVYRNKVKRNNINAVRDLTKITSDDEHIAYLLGLSLKSEDDREKVMEELSMYDMGQLKSLLNSSYGLFDGVSKKYGIDDLYDLEIYTGMNIDELISYVSKNRKSGRKK